ncbi:beta-lactamase family protein [Membranicola marinus]|uniref:Beta-lactamase family protein n=1 Tax=Membranihabitans marinus TaxID=1227546 RepID=A0A953HR22_9BACT|nr:serine hydrolase domain-containing protein [Membranihabitans marinus]MBY5959704.1 beta-lactamase family protein [Membranihabitans marinus]
MHIKWTRFIIILVMGITACNTPDKAPQKDLQTALQILIDSTFREFENRWDLRENKGGFFVMIDGPEGSYLASANQDPAMALDTRYRIASISKTFTAAAIMLLDQQGKLDIDDGIKAYLPDDPAYHIPFADQITIRLLLQHRAGVFDITNQDLPDTLPHPYAGTRYIDYVRSKPGQDSHTFTFQELIRVVAENGLYNHAPGETFHYSNTGYNLLGVIVEQVSGQTFSDFLHTHFMEPMNLRHTYSVVQGTDMEIKGTYLPSYLYLGADAPVNTSLDNMSPHVSEGQIVSTPRDIVHWISGMLIGESALDFDQINAMMAMEPADEAHGVYGLGLTYDDGLGFGHDGAHLSYISTLRYDPTTKATVLAVANFIRVNPENDNDQSFFELAYGVQDLARDAVKVYAK